MARAFEMKPSYLCDSTANHCLRQVVAPKWQKRLTDFRSSSHSLLEGEKGMGRCLPCRKGFTLVEVVIALAIFAFAAVVFTEGFTSILLSLDSLDQRTAEVTDIRFIRSQIIKEPDLDTFEEGGEVETVDSGTAYWQAVVEPAFVADLFDVTLTIELPETDYREAEVITERFYLLRPTWSEPLDRSEIIADNKERLEDRRIDMDWYQRR